MSDSPETRVIDLMEALKEALVAWEPPGLRFFDNASKREMLLVYDDAPQWAGWLFWRHPDGQWVSLRKATTDDRLRIGPFAQ